MGVIVDRNYCSGKNLATMRVAEHLLAGQSSIWETRIQVSWSLSQTSLTGNSPQKLRRRVPRPHNPHRFLGHPQLRANLFNQLQAQSQSASTELSYLMLPALVGTLDESQRR